MVASIDVSDECYPQARGQKPAASKVEAEPTVLVFEKVDLNKVEKNSSLTLLQVPRKIMVRTPICGNK